MATTVHLLWKITIPAPKVSHKVNKILFSWCIGIPRREKYEYTYGESLLLERIIFTPFLLERIYSQMARSRKGVVGRIGRNIPKNPKATDKDAIAMYMYFLIFY